MALNSAQLIATGQLDGFRNRIINGTMAIDQRNAGAAVTLTATSQFTVDRFSAIEVTDGTATVQQSTVAPAGFTNSLLFTVGTADASLAATQYANINQNIEGLNIADLGWGTANAQSVTISFWVRGSVTGTYPVTLRNDALDRSYVATFSISAANTWEKKIITVPGDTTGTWLTTNGRGIALSFSPAVGSTYQTTAGVWTAGNFFGTSSSVNLMATTGATFYLTGVQLEKGPVATDFDFRSYAQEFALCQRYYETLLGTSVRETYSTGTTDYIKWIFKVTKRANPTVTGANVSFNTVTNLAATTDMAVFNGANCFVWWQNATASIEL